MMTKMFSGLFVAFLMSHTITRSYGQYMPSRQNGGSGYGSNGGGGGGYGGSSGGGGYGQSSGLSGGGGGGGYGQVSSGGGGNGNSGSMYSQQSGQDAYSGGGGYGQGGQAGGYGQGQGLSGGGSGASGRGMDNGNPLNRLNPNYLGPRPDYCKRPTGQFAVANDCTSFYNCHENIAWIQKCPEGLGFNEQAYQCDYAEAVGCQAAAAAAAAAAARLQASANNYGSSGYGGSGYGNGGSGYSSGGSGSGYGNGGSGYSGSSQNYGMGGASGYSGGSPAGGYGQSQSMYGSASEAASPRISEFGSGSNGASNGNGLSAPSSLSSSSNGSPDALPSINLCTAEQAMQISSASQQNELNGQNSAFPNGQGGGDLQLPQQDPLSGAPVDETEAAYSTVYGLNGPSSGQVFCQPCRQSGVSCPSRPEARCFDDVCGGCRARFFERERNGSGPFVEVTSMCSSGSAGAPPQ